MYKLIVVEDEKPVREGIIDSFPWRDFGFKIVGSAENGVEALALIKKENPHAVITDIRMPFMNGLELAKAVNQLFPKIKIVMLSAYNDFNYAQDAIKYGAKGYLLKPLKEDDLEEVMHRIAESIKEEHRVMNSDDLYLSENDMFLKHILSDGHSDENTVYDKESDLKIDLKEYVRIAVCSFYLFIDEDTRKILYNYILSKSFDYWNNLNIRVALHNNYFTIFLDDDKIISRKDASNFIQLFKIYIEKEMELKNCSYVLTFGVGNCYNKIENVKKSYNEALYAYDSKYFNGKGSNIFFQDIRRSESRSIDLGKINDSVVNLVNSVILCDKFQIIKDVHEMFNFIWQEQNLSEYDIRLVCTEAVFAISVRVKEKGYDSRILDRKNVVESLNRIDAFDNLKKWFGELIISVSDEIRQLNNGKKMGHVNKAKEYVAQNYANRITLEEVCKYLYINPAYFSVAFKKATGKNFIDFVNEVRVEKSKELLIESEYRIKEIAQMVGFDNLSYFCTVFKKSTGATPLEFRSGVLSYEM